MIEPGYSKQTLQRARDLRGADVPAEARLWTALRGNRAGPRFRRQQPIGKFIVDFYCAEHRLVIEIDGDSHSERAAYDTRRTEWLESQGYYVLRFSNSDVHERLAEVVRGIGAVIALPLPGRQAATGPSPSRGEG